MVRIEESTVIAAPVERCFDLARSVEVHLEGNVHWGESAVALEGATSGLLGEGDRVTWQARHFLTTQTLTSAISAMNRPAHFQDVMVRGAFAWMRHDHFFAQEDGRTRMTDVFSFAAPLGPLGRIAEWAVLRRYMRALLRERNKVIKSIAESGRWREFLK